MRDHSGKPSGAHFINQLALAAYGFLVAYLPDTGRPHFLLAVTATLLLISLRTLLRAFLLLRQRGRAASAP